MNILKKKLNLNLKIKPINLNKNYEDYIKYYAPISKEWKNSVYFFNKINMKNIAINDLSINKLINSYCNVFFKRKFLKTKKKKRKPFSKRFKLFTIIKLFASKAEIKHYNFKTIVTVFIYDRHRVILTSKIKYNKRRIYLIIKNFILFYAKLNKWYINYKKSLLVKISPQLKIKLRRIVLEKLIWVLILKKICLEKITTEITLLNYIKNIKIKKNLFMFSMIISLRQNILGRLIKLEKNKWIPWIIDLKELKKQIFKTKKLFNNLRLKLRLRQKKYLTKMYSLWYWFRIRVQRKLRRQLRALRILKYAVNLNRYKFEEKFLYILSNLLNKFYKKKIEFNIVKIKNIRYNTDMFTEMLALKFTRQRLSIAKSMGGVFNITDTPEYEEIKPVIKKFKVINLFQNEVKDLHLNYALGLKENLDVKLGKIFNNVVTIDWTDKNKNMELYKNTINSIKYKKFRGVKVGSKGRLTRRYRADRAVDKLFLEGGFRNLDSSFKGLSVSLYRGINNTNVEYSICVKKRRIGAYAVKGWLSYY